MKQGKPNKVRTDKYQTKLKIRGTLDEVLKVMVKSPAPSLEKRKGNRKK